MTYEELFEEIENECLEEGGSPNAFYEITLGEFKELNFLFDRLLLFCQENEEILEEDDLEEAQYILKLGELVDRLFTRSFNGRMHPKS